MRDALLYGCILLAALAAAHGITTDMWRGGPTRAADPDPYHPGDDRGEPAAGIRVNPGREPW